MASSWNRSKKITTIILAGVLILATFVVMDLRDRHAKVLPATNQVDTGRISSQNAQGALAKLGLHCGVDGFADANRISDPDLILLYLRCGISPNAAEGIFFLLEIPLIRNSDRFGELLKIYQTKGLEPLDFKRQNRQGKTLEYRLFSELEPGDEHSTENGRALVEAGASPDSLLQQLGSERTILLEAAHTAAPPKQIVEEQLTSRLPEPQLLLTKLEGRVLFLESLRP